MAYVRWLTPWWQVMVEDMVLRSFATQRAAQLYADRINSDLPDA